MLANVTLALEYEATCRRAEHGVAAGLSQVQVGIFIDAVMSLAEPVETHLLCVLSCAIPAMNSCSKRQSTAVLMRS